MPANTTREKTVRHSWNDENSAIHKQPHRGVRAQSLVCPPPPGGRWIAIQAVKEPLLRGESGVAVRGTGHGTNPGAKSINTNTENSAKIKFPGAVQFFHREEWHQLERQQTGASALLLKTHRVCCVAATTR